MKGGEKLYRLFKDGQKRQRNAEMQWNWRNRVDEEWERIPVYVDGTCVGDVGRGVAIIGKQRYFRFNRSTDSTRNEIEAVMLALEKLPVGSFATIYCDNRPAVDVLNSQCKQRKWSKPLVEQVQAIVISRSLNVRYKWKPREENKEADHALRERTRFVRRRLKHEKTAKQGEAQGE